MTNPITISQKTRKKRALDDLVYGLMSWRIWGHLAWHDIKQRYRRTTLGPFWMVISTAAWIAGMGFVFEKLFGMDMEVFFPYMSVGIVIWVVLSLVLTEAPSHFVANAELIRSVNVPLSIHAFRVTFRHLITFLHNFPTIIGIMIFFSIDLNLSTLLFIPGLIIVTLNVVWVNICLGLLGARYRDISQAMTSIMQPAMFCTPVFWNIDILGGHRWAAEFNPLYHFIEILRAPLLGGAPSLQNYAVTILLCVVGWLVTIILFARYRGRIQYWL